MGAICGTPRFRSSCERLLSPLPCRPSGSRRRSAHHPERDQRVRLTRRSGSWCPPRAQIVLLVSSMLWSGALAGQERAGRLARPSPPIGAGDDRIGDPAQGSASAGLGPAGRGASTKGLAQMGVKLPNRSPRRFPVVFALSGREPLRAPRNRRSNSTRRLVHRAGNGSSIIPSLVWSRNPHCRGKR